MNDTPQTRWAGLLIITDRKVLALKETNKDFYQLPGGKMEGDETPEQTVVREVSEELAVDATNLEFFVEVTETAKTTGKTMVFKLYTGKIGAIPGRTALPPKTEAVRYIDTNYIEHVADIGNLLKLHIFPLLKARDLID